MVFLEDNNKQETLLEKIKECDNDMAFDQFINVSNNTYDQCDLFSVLCCKAWVLLNYINNDEILSQMIAPDPSRLPVGGSKKQNRISNQNNCNIPIYNPMEMRDPARINIAKNINLQTLVIHYGNNNKIVILYTLLKVLIMLIQLVVYG